MRFGTFKTQLIVILAAGYSNLATPPELTVAADAVKPAKAKSDLSWVDQRVKEWVPSKEDLRFDQIGWAKSLPDAQRLAREEKRPLFVFTYSGSATEANAIALRRC